MPLQIFISHRFQDAGLANALRLQLQALGFSQDHIFQAGAPNHGLVPGEPINEKLITRIKQTDLFILIFTETDEDWSYCMWELGLATGQDSKDTRVVVIRCAESLPHVRAENLAVDIRNPQSVADFVHRLHSDPSFVVPDDNARAESESFLSVLAGATPTTVQDRARVFHEKMLEALPNGNPREEERLEYLGLTLAHEHVRRVRELRKLASEQGSEAPRDEAKALLQRELRMTTRSSNRAASRFGLSSVQRDVSLDDLLRGWRDECASAGKANCDDGWILPFLDDLSRATEGRRSKPTDETMPDAEEDGLRFMPVVVRLRELRAGDMEYDVYLIRAPIKGSEVSAKPNH